MVPCLPSSLRAVSCGLPTKAPIGPVSVEQPRLAGQGLAITEDSLQAAMALSHVPDPDLLLRTGGELRISNFLLWQSAYTELYFTDTLWPDFDEQSLDAALHDYRRRERRFGKTSEQVQQGDGAAC